MIDGSRLKPFLSALVVLMVAAGGSPAFGKKNNPNVHLVFTPQQAVAASIPDLSSQMTSRPVELRVHDGRNGDDPKKIGTRSDDDDRLHVLRAVEEVGPFVRLALGDICQRWGLRAEDGAGLVLDVRLAVFDVVETNQAVGATFNANVRLSAELKQRGDDKVLWSGSETGDATRYGKKYSNENVNEVLSDALLEAFANLLSQPGLHDAWSK